MDLAIDLISVIYRIAVDIVLFSRISGRKFTIKDCPLVLLIYLLFPTILTFLEQSFYSKFNILDYLLEPFRISVLAFVYMRGLPISLILFYGLSSSILQNLFYRFHSFFLFPIWGWDNSMLEITSYWIVFYFSSFIGAMWFIRWSGYDFKQLKNRALDIKEKQLLRVANINTIFYFFSIELLTYQEFDLNIDTLSLRRLLVSIELLIFIGIINQLDRRLKIHYQEQIQFQQELQLINMENYSNQVEGLYKEVRSFRHDYANLLTTLKLGIENKDINLIEDIYQSVLKDSNKSLRGHKFDIARLSNIDNSALKSLLAAKFSQAREFGIDIRLEVPEVIKPQGMDLVDFITIVSILCDNAIEAASETEKPEIQIAYLLFENYQSFVIENSSQELYVSTNDLYSYGCSSKGSKRGVGLYNVMKIMERYPNVSIQTQNNEHKFSQTLEINTKTLR
ncbi:sensor histidine kinase [Streptococcus pluranimalium]|uniref:Sensor protein CitS n=1 Tax=Streptococcus pluranimalium TaxID=82348 RepID=A0A345VLB4_9STRE|nr:GHKL domain-containing protein [Streptococcus pluranimalium]AXJ13516.1 Sensor protein CitS [Streptococcus pluranimalium]